MRVSVVIPSYNHARYLRRCIDSALEQTLHPWEVIVIDDGSTDESREIIASYGNAVRAVCQQNEGTYPTLNRGIALATGDWVAVHNSDDYWEPDKLARQAAIAASCPEVALVHTAGRYVDQNDQPYTFPAGKHGVDYHGPACDDLLPLLMVSNPIIISSALIRRQPALDAGGFNPRLKGRGDWEFCLRLSHDYPFGFVDEPLTDVRVHVDNSGSNPDRLAGDWEYLDWDVAGRAASVAAAKEVLSRALAGRYQRDRAALALASLGTIMASTREESLSLRFLLMSLRLEPVRLKTYFRLATLLLPHGPRRRLFYRAYMN